MKTRSFLLAAGVSLVMALTFSCSSDDGGGDGTPSSSSMEKQGGRSSSSVGGVSSSSSSVGVSSYSSSSSLNSSSSVGISSSSSIGNGGNGSVSYYGQTYRTVRIGEQVWFAENLNYDVSGSKCYSNNPSNCTTYGRLYDWATAMALPSSCNSNSCSSQIQSKHKGICPSGWHIPSDAEWTTLENFVGSNAGTKLKATSGWYNNGNGTDEYGFSALPGGNGYSGDNFGNASGLGHWWSATENDANFAYYRGMFYYYDNVDRNYYGKSFLFSLRCVQD